MDMMSYVGFKNLLIGAALVPGCSRRWVVDPMTGVRPPRPGAVVLPWWGAGSLPPPW